jgi:hypothetical protein
MPAAVYNTVIEKSNTGRRIWTWYTDATKSTTVDLTGYTARMRVLAAVDAAAILVEHTTANGGVVLGGAAGTISWDQAAIYAAGDTAKLSNVFFTLYLIDAGGVATRRVQGTFQLSAGD